MRRRELETVGREIARAALYGLTQRQGRADAAAVGRAIEPHRRDSDGRRKDKLRVAEDRRPPGSAPTLERFRHGDTIERYDGPVVEAGLVGHRVVDACLLDRLREKGVLGSGRAGLLRHSAGLWLCALFDATGLRQELVTRLDGAPAGSESGHDAVFERSAAASRAMARYLAVMTAMETRALYGRDRDGLERRAMDAPARKRATRIVREICCWDRLPMGVGPGKIRAAFDRLAAMEEIEVEE